MAMMWTQKQREIYELFVKGMSFSQVVEQGYVKSLVSKVQQAFKSGEKPGEPKPVPSPSSPKVTTSGTIPAGGFVTPGNRPPVIFDLGQQTIPLSWQSLYESYRYYDDLVAEEELEDGFGETLLWCIKDVWKRMRTSTRIDNGKIVTEVTDGKHGRTGEEEVGDQQN
jgi:hypothetical protein